MTSCHMFSGRGRLALSEPPQIDSASLKNDARTWPAVRQYLTMHYRMLLLASYAYGALMLQGVDHV